MKKTILLLAIVLTACGGNNSPQYQRLQEELAQARDSVKLLTTTIEALSYPASQRLATIQSLIKEERYVAAESELRELVALFPKSDEAKKKDALTEIINKGKEAKEAKEKRQKALGFKALKASSSVKIDYNMIEFSGFNVGNKFSFDANDSGSYSFTADRGNKYITASMRVASESKDPLLPQLAVYSISGGSMTHVKTFVTRFARWQSYGTFLGNYHDNGNDFAKTSSVNFKVGAEVPEEITKKPYALVLKKENGLSRQTDRFKEPPVSYTGAISYPAFLSLDDFTSPSSQYVVVRIVNL